MCTVSKSHKVKSTNMTSCAQLNPPKARKRAFSSAGGVLLGSHGRRLGNRGWRNRSARKGMRQHRGKCPSTSPLSFHLYGGRSNLGRRVKRYIHVANILATTWRKDTKRLTSVSHARSSRYPHTKESVSMRNVRPTMARFQSALTIGPP